MNSEQLNPYINKPYKQKLMLREQQTIKIKTSKMYTCPQCKKNDAKYWKMQTRSGDEGYTIFVNCQLCGFRWRIYG